MAQYRTPMMESLENRTLLSVNTPVGLTPQQIRHAYNADKLWYRNHAIEQTYKATGIGQAIAIVDAYDHPRITSDFKVFNRTFGLPSYGKDGDLLLQKKVAPAADPDLTLSQPPVDLGWDTEIALDVQWAHVIAPWAKIYLVEAQSALDSDMLAAIDFARNIPGVSAVSMSFTSFFSIEQPFEGAYDHYLTTPPGHIAGGGTEGGITFLAAAGDAGAGDAWPAVSPNALSIGGTVLTVDSQGNWLGESGWSGSGGGPPLFSTKTTSPDVSMIGGTGVAVYNSMPHGPNRQTGWESVIGTSLSTPLWAGIIALVNEGRTLLNKPSLDGAHDVLPWLATDPQGDFHDITVGNNGYPATPGVDYVTGIGTPKIHKVARDLILWNAPVLA
jgi:subtilase family serine protease